MKPTPFSATLDAYGRPSTVVIDGVDISDRACGFAIVARPGEATRLTVELIGEGAIEGLAEVTIVSPAAELGQFFTNLDAEELEKEALARLGGFDDGNVTQAILDVLADWALGR